MYVVFRIFRYLHDIYINIIYTFYLYIFYLYLPNIQLLIF